MIQSLSIKRFQGVFAANVDNITPFTILVGPNGAGKSTLLRAIEICTSADLVAAFSRAAIRQPKAPIWPQIKWLFFNGDTRETIQISSNVHYTIDDNRYRVGELITKASYNEPKTQVGLRCHGTWTPGGTYSHALTLGLGENSLLNIEEKDKDIMSRYGPIPSLDVKVVEPYSSHSDSLGELYQRVVNEGRRGRVSSILRGLVPGFLSVELLPNKGTWEPHIAFEERSIPVALVGDGVRLLLRLALELAAFEGGVSLVEEPEVHLHPAAMRKCAQALVATVEHGVQVIVTTHSLDMIDAIVSTFPEERLDDLSLFRLQRQANGHLITSRLPGPDVAFARSSIEDDLR